MLTTKVHICARNLDRHLSIFHSWPNAITKPVVIIFWLWLLAFSTSEKSQKMNFRYRLDLQEELPRSTVVTNLQGLLHQVLSEFPEDNRAFLQNRKTKFRFLEPNILFYIDSNNPNEQLLRIQSRVDREAGCTTDSLCCQQANPSGQTDLYSSPGRSDDCTLVILFLVDVLSSNGDYSGLEQILFQLNLRILDINDNTPTWSTATSTSVGAQYFNTSAYLHTAHIKMPVTIPRLHVSIPEHMAIGTQIALPLAVDLDAAPDNTTTSYKIESQTEADSFVLDWNDLPDNSVAKSHSANPVDDLKPLSGLWLRVNMDLDHDRQPEMFVIISASDSSGISSRTGYLLLNISVTDINDHPPKFKQKTDQVWVQEHSVIGSVVYHALASDADSSDQGRLTFDFSPSMLSTSRQLFLINKHTGEVTVSGVLDYEQAYQHRLVISLSDGKWMDEMLLLVNVLNVNDHAPEITLHSHLAVFAGDTNAPQSPQFRLNQAHLSIVVPENGSPDQLIATVTVRDKDFSTNLRANVPADAAELKNNKAYLAGDLTQVYTPYQLSRSPEPRPTCKLNSDQFQIDPLQIDDLMLSDKFRFKISLSGKPLDREQQSHIHLQIMCQDEAVFPAYGDFSVLHRSTSVAHEKMGYSDARTATALLRIIVSDENDCRPAYNGPYSTKLLENAPSDTSVLQLQATDADEPSTNAGNTGLRYSLNGPVRLILADKLANERINRSDDNKAVTGASLPETFSSLPPQPWFYLNALTGELKTLVQFDRESFRAVMVPVEIRDGGNLAEVDSLKAQTKHNINHINITLTVDIIDVNDCTPTFSNQIYELNVSENARLPMHLGKLDVVDCDVEESNRRLEFIVKDSPYQSGGQFPGQVVNQRAEDRFSFARWFSVAKSGDLFYRTPAATKTVRTDSIDSIPEQPLDREKTELIVLDVFARDSGSPALTGSAQLLIHVLDVNDHAPEWQFPRPKNRSVNVSMDTPIGHEVTRLVATDPDEGPRGRVTYTILSGNEAGLFELQPETGQIYVAQALLHRVASTSQIEAIVPKSKWHHLSQPVLRMYVQASDQGSPPRTSSSVLDFHVQSPFSLKTSQSPANQKSDRPFQTVDLRFQPPVTGKDPNKDASMVRKAWVTPAEETATHSKGIVPTSDFLTLIAMITATLAALLFICILFVVLRCRRLKARPEPSFMQISNRPTVYRDPRPQSAYAKHTDSGVGVPACLIGLTKGEEDELDRGSCSILRTQLGCFGWASHPSPQPSMDNNNNNCHHHQLRQTTAAAADLRAQMGQQHYHHSEQVSPSTCLLSPANKTLHDREQFATVCTLTKLQGTPIADPAHISNLLVYTSKWPSQAGDAGDCYYYQTNSTAKTAASNEYNFLVHTSCPLDTDSQDNACHRILFNNSEAYQKRHYLACENQSPSEFALLPPHADPGHDWLFTVTATTPLGSTSRSDAKPQDAPKASVRITEAQVRLKDGYTALTNNGESLDGSLSKFSPPGTLQTTTVTTAASHTSSFV